MRRGSGCVGSTLFFGIFFAVGVGISIYGWTVLQNGRDSENWPSTQGQIVNSAVRVSSDEDGTTYHADVTFDYVVNDHRYTGDEVSFGQYGSSNRNHAREIVARYASGTGVLVYYNPEQSQTAVLEPGVTWSSFFILGMGLCFSIIPSIGIPLRTLSRRR